MASWPVYSALTFPETKVSSPGAAMRLPPARRPTNAPAAAPAECQERPVESGCGINPAKGQLQAGLAPMDWACGACGPRISA